MTTEAKAVRGEVVPVNGSPVALSSEVAEQYSAIFATIPDAGGDALDGILLTIANVTDARDLDAPWRSAGLEALANVPIRVTGLRKAPSEYAGGLPFFLVVDAVIIETGEVVTVTTGAVSVVAQLARAWAINALPLNVIPRISDRPSKSGYYPQHLQIGR